MTPEEKREWFVNEAYHLLDGLNKKEILSMLSELAKKKRENKALIRKKSELEKFFASQLEKLASIGMPGILLETLREEKETVVTKAAQMEIRKENIPFLPIVPRSHVGIYTLMPMVKNNNKEGYTYINPLKLKNDVVTPDFPYHIFDVEIKKAGSDKYPTKKRKSIEYRKRFCLTVDEVIAIGIHTEFPNHRIEELGAFGTDYGSSVSVPFLCLNDDGRPTFKSCATYEPNEKISICSCAFRAEM